MKQNNIKNQITIPGENCWRLENASRVKIFYDSSSYFDDFAETVQHARHSIFIIGWDIHSKLNLRRGDIPDDQIWELAELLNTVADKRRAGLFCNLLLRPGIKTSCLVQEQRGSHTQQSGKVSKH